MSENGMEKHELEGMKYEPEHMKQTKAREWLDTFSSTTSFMKKVFVVAAAVCFLIVFVMFFVSRDHTTQAEKEDAFLMSPASTEEFMLETKSGTMCFRLVGMKEEKCDTADFRRVLLTYSYRVTKGHVDISKLAFSASYIGDSESPFGVMIIPIGSKNKDISEMHDIGVMKDYDTGSVLIEIPENVGTIYTDIGGSASISGRPSWLVYRVGEVFDKEDKD